MIYRYAMHRSLYVLYVMLLVCVCSCYGDSGGPLLKVRETDTGARVFHQVGLVSWGLSWYVFVFVLSSLCCV